MLIVTGVKGAIFVGRLCWELVVLPFDLVDEVLNPPRPEPRPANISYYVEPTKKNQSKGQTRSAA